jgi:signal transduction histidine kinase
VHLHAHNETDIVRINIEDNGIGIAPAEQHRLFKPFSQLHGIETYPGVGLGLATARKAVELMRGRIGVNSTGGQGSQFWIELPVVPDTIQEEQHALPHR